MKVIFEGEKEKQKDDFPLTLANLSDGDGFELKDGRIGILHKYNGAAWAIFYSENANSASGFNIAQSRFESYPCRRRQLRITVDPL